MTVVVITADAARPASVRPGDHAVVIVTM